MNKTINFFKAAMILLAAVFIVGCEEDTPGGGIGGGLDDPDLTLGSDLFVTIGTQEEFVITVSAASNGADLNTIEVLEDGVSLPFERIQYDGETANSNPKLLFDAEKSAFTSDITVTSHSFVGDAEYTVVVTDEDSNTSSVTVTVTTTGTEPSISIFGNSTVEVEVNSGYNFDVTGEIGSSDLYSLAIYIDGTLADASRLEFAGVPLDANPYILPSGYVEGFDEQVTYRVGDVPGTYDVEMTLTDNAGLSSSANSTLIVNPEGTPIFTFDVYVNVYNSDSPNPTGGLDLDAEMAENATVMANSDLAEIRDMGIDTDLPNASNWIQKITGVNGATLKYIQAGVNGVPENFTFADIEFQEQLTTLFDQGTSTDDNVSNVVNVGDMFIVENNGNYYALYVNEVNPTVDDNNDYYQFDIKR